MILILHTHPFLMKGGDYCIQLIFNLTKRCMVIIIWFYKIKGIINHRNNDDSGSILNPGKYIMRFLKLRTRFTSLHPEIDNSFRQPKRRIRVKKLTLETQRR